MRVCGIILIGQEGLFLEKILYKFLITLLIAVALPLNAFAIGDLWGEQGISPEIEDIQTPTELNSNVSSTQALKD